MQRERRPLVPSSRLTAASNVAQPVLSSHRESIAQAQRSRAAEETAPSTSSTPVNNLNDPTGSAAGSPLSVSLPPTLATPTTSQPPSVPPTSNASSENEDDRDKSDQPTITATKPKRKRRKESGAGDTAHTDKDGMYQDVTIIDIDGSDSPNSENKKKNKNPKADIEQFFELAQYIKGDKRGRRKCKTCA